MIEAKKKHKLRIAYRDKVITRLVSFRRDSGIGFNSRVVYSVLLYRARRKKKNIAISISKIAALSRLARNTVSAILPDLERKRLVRRISGKWIYCEPDTLNEDWFGYRDREAKDILSRFAYQYLVMPAPGSPLSLIDCAVMLQDEYEPGLVASRVAARLGIHRKTVARSRQRLKRVGQSRQSWFLDIPTWKRKPEKMSEPINLTPIEPPTMPKPEKPKKKFGIESLPCQQDVKRLVGKMQAHRWDETDIRNAFHAMATTLKPHIDDEAFYGKLLSLNNGKFEELMTIHKRKGRSGYSGVDLFIHEIQGSNKVSIQGECDD